ncbi:MAG: helix-turn-helix transcriptional regulator [Acidimicrobiia bacterium]
MTDGPRWDLVALAVRYRREQLGYSVDDLAAHVGVPAASWRTLEAGTRPSGFHKEHAVAASTALGWTPDSLTRIVRGQRPLDAAGALPTLARSARPEAGRAAPPLPAPSGRSEAGRAAPSPAQRSHSAPWYLAPVCSRGADGVRQVDPARLGVLGGLLILVLVVAVFFVN